MEDVAAQSNKLMSCKIGNTVRDKVRATVRATVKKDRVLTALRAKNQFWLDRAISPADLPIKLIYSEDIAAVCSVVAYEIYACMEACPFRSLNASRTVMRSLTAYRDGALTLERLYELWQSISPILQSELDECIYLDLADVILALSSTHEIDAYTVDIIASFLGRQDEEDAENRPSYPLLNSICLCADYMRYTAGHGYDLTGDLEDDLEDDFQDDYLHLDGPDAETIERRKNYPKRPGL